MYSTKRFASFTKEQLKVEAVNYYRDYLQGRTVVNKETAIAIEFNKVGRVKTARTLPTKERLIVICNMPVLLSNAKRLNYKQPKPSHVANYGAIGFINFQIKANIDGRVKKFKVGVMILKGGKFQYNLNESFY